MEQIEAEQRNKDDLLPSRVLAFDVSSAFDPSPDILNILLKVKFQNSIYFKLAHRIITTDSEFGKRIATSILVIDQFNNTSIACEHTTTQGNYYDLKISFIKLKIFTLQDDSVAGQVVTDMPFCESDNFSFKINSKWEDLDYVYIGTDDSWPSRDLPLLYHINKFQIFQGVFFPSDADKSQNPFFAFYEEMKPIQRISEHFTRGAFKGLVGDDCVVNNCQICEDIAKCRVCHFGYFISTNSTCQPVDRSTINYLQDWGIKQSELNKVPSGKFKMLEIQIDGDVTQADDLYKINPIQINNSDFLYVGPLRTQNNEIVNKILDERTSKDANNNHLFAQIVFVDQNNQVDTIDYLTFPVIKLLLEEYDVDCDIMEDNSMYGVFPYVFCPSNPPVFFDKESYFSGPTSKSELLTDLSFEENLNIFSNKFLTIVSNCMNNCKCERNDWKFICVENTSLVPISICDPATGPLYRLDFKKDFDRCGMCESANCSNCEGDICFISSSDQATVTALETENSAMQRVFLNDTSNWKENLNDLKIITTDIGPSEPQETLPDNEPVVVPDPDPTQEPASSTEPIVQPEVEPTKIPPSPDVDLINTAIPLPDLRLLFSNDEYSCYMKPGFSSKSVKSNNDDFHTCEYTQCGPDCLVCSEPDICLLCKNDTYKLINFKCQILFRAICKPGFLFIQSKCEINRATNCEQMKLYWDEGQDMATYGCETCAAGFSLDNSNKKCVKQWYELQDHLQRRNEQRGEYTQDRKCAEYSMGKCVACQQGYYMVEENQRTFCQGCGPNITQCRFDHITDKVQILACSNQLVIDHKLNQCREQTSPFVIVNCPRMQFYDSVMDTCRNCPPNCIWCDSTERCIQCRIRFDLTSQNKCLKICNIFGIFKNVAEEYIENKLNLVDTNQESLPNTSTITVNTEKAISNDACRKCSECEFCQMRDHQPCPTCMKCQSQCHLNLSKKSKNLFVLDFSDWEVDVQAIRSENPRLLIKQITPKSIEISDPEFKSSITPTETNQTLKISTRHLRANTCMSVQSLYLFEIKNQGGRVLPIEKAYLQSLAVYRLKDVILPTTSLILSEVYFLFDFINLSDLYSFNISQFNDEQSLTGFFKMAKIRNYKASIGSFEKHLLSVTDIEELEIFYAFVQSPMVNVGGKNLLNKFIVVIFPIMAFFWWARMFALKHQKAIELVDKFNNLKLNDAEFNKEEYLRQHKDNARFNYWLKRPKLLKVAKVGLINRLQNEQIFWSQMLNFFSISFAQILVRFCILQRLFPGKFFFRATIVLVGPHFLFMSKALEIGEAFSLLAAKKELTKKEVYSLKTYRKNLFNFVFFHGLILLVICFYRFPGLYYNAIFCYILGSLIIKSLFYLNFENIYAFFLVEVVLLVYFNYSRCLYLSETDSSSPFNFDAFFVVLNFCQLVSVLVSKYY